VNSTELAANLIAAGVVALLVFGLSRLRREFGVAQEPITYTTADAIAHTLAPGDVVPATDLALAETAGGVRRSHRTGLSSIVVGTDNRLSTSKTMVFAWTAVITYGLLALLVAKALGAPAGWTAQVDNGLQEEYLVLLGGPFAAAIIAKLSAVSQVETQGKPPAPPASTSASQLVTDDAGDTDLGDLQYVLFNVLALVFFLAEFWQDFSAGFPDLPALLAGLVLTSTGGYAAKKLIKPGGPALTSVIPAGPGAVQLYGTNLVIAAAISPTGAALPPLVFVDRQPATITAATQILGADRLTVTLPPIEPGSHLISAVRADGIPAVGPAGSDGIVYLT
jgi:hypothetical protein